MFHQPPVSRRQQQSEQLEDRLDYHNELEESQTSVLIGQKTVPSSGQVSPTASSTSYVTCTPDISHSIQTGSSSATLAKIIDIQRTTKRRCNGNDQQQRRSAASSRNNVPVPVTGNSAINNQEQQVVSGVGVVVDQSRWTPSNTTVAETKEQSQQKQQSGETLSSFESDYDLLVYLGETETEDIVDTERSLDYQDQTWRQSICGGTSLAPTIDESLSELIGSGGNNFNNNQAYSSYPDFDLLNTPTISPFKAHSPSPPRSASTSFQQPPRQLLKDEISPKLASYNRRQAQSSKSVQQQIKEAESDDECGHEVSLVFKQQQIQASTSGKKSPFKSQQVAHNSQAQVKRLDLQQVEESQLQLRNQQQQQKSVGNIGNKLVSLFNRKQTPRDNDSQPQPVPVEHKLERFRNDDFVKPESSLDSELHRVGSRTLGVRQELNDNRVRRSTEVPNDDDSRLLQDKYRDSDRIRGASLLGTKSAAGNTNMMPSHRQGNNNESSSSAMSANDAAELDRLLAEMNQSLDLNSLARYDPIRGYSSAQVGLINFGYSGQQPVVKGTSQTLSKFHHQASSSSPKSTQLNLRQQQQDEYTQAQAQQVFYKDNNNKNRLVTKSNFIDNNNRLKQQTLPNKWKNVDTNSDELYQNTQASCESILDEYDGASKMLEQMISDQLDGNKAFQGQNSAFKCASSRSSEVRTANEIKCVDPATGKKSDSNTQKVSNSVVPSINNKQHTANSSSPSANSATSRRESKSSVIYREEPINVAAQAASSDQEHTATTSSSFQEQSRKVSTCSSSMTNTDATSVVLAATKVGGELAANKRNLFENRSVWRHRRSTKSSGHTATPPSGEENSSSALKLSKKSALVTQLSLDQPLIERNSGQRALTSHSLVETRRANVLEAKNNSIIEVGVEGESKKRINGLNSNSSTNINNSQAPTPPAVDYGDSDGAEVIRVEAAAITSSSSEGEINVLREESQIDRMKRRTLTSMRSMRNRFSDFMGNNTEKLSQQQVVSANKRSHQRGQPALSSPPPRPPKRSSSIGSQGSRGGQSQVISSNNNHEQSHQVVIRDRFNINNSETNKSERLSRSKRRSGRASSPLQNTNDSQSFGQQIRERLSRSKSRLSKFLRPAAKRAQSTPNTKSQDSKVELEHDDDKLFQPSDIARNCNIQRATTISDANQNRAQKSDDSFNESLDRHLAASLNANKEMTTALKTSYEESDLSLSGLDETQSRSRSKAKKRKSNTMLPNMKDTKEQQQQQQQQHQQGHGRSKSLLSIKRLSSFRNKDNNLDNGQTNKQMEDFDSFRVNTTNELLNKNGKKRRRNRIRKRSEKNRSSDEQSSQASPVVQPRVSITNDYFGQIGPAKADSHDEALKGELSSSCSSDPSKKKGKIVMLTDITSTTSECNEQQIVHDKLKIEQQKVNTSSADGGSSASASKDLSNKELETIQCYPKRPKRSQSLKCIGQNGANFYESLQQVVDNNGNKPCLELPKESRTSSFSNLNRRLPSSTNTFRPISACAKLDDRLQNDPPSLSHTNPGNACTRVEVVTPIGPSNSLLSGYRLDSTKPPQLDHQHSYKGASQSSRPSGSVSPIRAKSAAVLDDIRNRCSEFFTSPQAKRKAAQRKDKQTTASPDLRPVRPPRKSNKSSERPRRSKSVHAGVAIGQCAPSDSDDGACDSKQVILARAASPSSTLDGDTFSPRNTPTPKGNKFSAFAQHVRQTFQGSGNRRGRGATDTRPRSPVIVEPTATTTLVEWKPVITRGSEQQKRSTIGGVNKQLISQLGQTSKDNDAHGHANRIQNIQRQSNHRSLDTDSTWESSGDEILDESERGTQQQQTGDESSKGKQPKKRQQRGLLEREDDNYNGNLLQANKLPVSDAVVSDELEPSLNERAARSTGKSNKSLSALEQSNAANVSRRGKCESLKQQQQSIGEEGFTDLEVSDNNNNHEGDNQDEGEESVICTSNEWKQNHQDNSKQRQKQMRMYGAKNALLSASSTAIIGDSRKESSKEASNKRPIDVVSNQNQHQNNEDLQASLSEPDICKTQFKFNADLPAPSQVIKTKFGTSADEINIGEIKDRFCLQTSDSNRKEALIDPKQEDKESIESIARSDADPAALLNAQQQEVTQTDMAAIASYRPIKKSGLTLDEADANFLKVINHSKISKSEEAPKCQHVKDETEDTAQNRLSIYENVDNNEQSRELGSQAQAQAQAQFQSQFKSQAQLEGKGKDGEVEQVKRERKWRKPVPQLPPPPPVVGQKPAHLVFNQKKILEASVLAKSAEANKRRVSTSSPPDSPESWSVDDDGVQQMLPLEHSKSEKQFIKEKLDKLIKADAENESKGQAPSPKPERKLVSMTSITQDPNDKLMIGALSSKQQQQTTLTSNEPDQENKSAVKISVAQGVKSLQRRDSTFSFGGADDASDTDSSFATAAESRKRLLTRFEQTMLGGKSDNEKVDSERSEGPTKTSTTANTRPKFPAFTEGRLAEGTKASGSLVKRMAKNFDQTIREHTKKTPPPISSRKPPIAIKPVVNKTPAPIRLIPGSAQSSFEQTGGQKSESVWHDANNASSSLEEVGDIDEVELAEFLREFDDDGKKDPQSSGEKFDDKAINNLVEQRAKQDIPDSKQTLLVTEISLASEEAGSVSTGIDPFVTIADSTLQEDDERGQAIDDLSDQQVSHGHDDNTLNGDEFGSEVLDENDNSEQYVSLATSASRSPSAESDRQLKQQQQHQKEQQGKDNTSDNAADSMATKATRALQLINISSKKKASVDDSRESDKDELDDIERRTKTKVPEKSNVVLDSQLIDNKFKNSLNNIIAQQQNKRSFNQHLLAEPESTENMTTDEQQQQQQIVQGKATSNKSGKSCCLTRNKEFKGLSKYYFALLKKHSGRHKHLDKSSNQEVPVSTKEDKQQAGKAAADDYIQSTSDSSISESSESDDDVLDVISSIHFSDDENSETGKIDSKKLVRAAKKCSRLYDELERILANRATNELVCKKITASRKIANQRTNTNQNLNETNIDDKKTTATKTTTTTSATGEGNDDYDDDELGDHYEESFSTLTERYDQVSLSSSSVSSDSIPEIKQRQNLQKLYHIVKEIYSSEAKFVDTLKLLNEDFRQYVFSNPQSTTLATSTSSLTSSGSSSSKLYTQALPTECISPILKHLPPLQALSENLLAELKFAKDQWPKTQKIAHVLVKIGPFLKHYSTYIREFESIQRQFTDNMKKYPQFAEKVKEFESSERCQRLTIQHHLLKPIQRIPQYRLLLQKYLHHLKPDNVDYEDTVNALEVVSRVAEHANQAMCEGANFAKLLALQAKIVGKQRDIVQPGRLFVKEGELLKVCRKQIQPRWFILLNDALLYLTQIQSSDILYLNKELPLDDCSVSIPTTSEDDRQSNNNSTTNNTSKQHIDTEFTVTTKTRAFALIAKSRQERDDWVAVFKKTIDDHIARRLSFSNRQQKADADITQYLERQ